jgi:signal transduction histidine kinase
MPFQHLSRRLTSLRFRLTIWNTLVVMLAVLAALVSVREGLRYSLNDETDRILLDEASALVLAVKEYWPDEEAIRGEMERKADSSQEVGWHVRWLDANRKTIFASANAPAEPLGNFAGRVGDGIVWSLGDIRSVEKQVTTGVTTYVRVGMDTSFIAKDVARMTRVLLPIALALCILAPLGGFILATRAVNPFQKILASADILRPRRLEDRLKIRGAGDELDLLAIKINAFLDEIASQINRNNSFLANAAHELRSPLAAMISQIDVALSKSRETADYQEILETLLEECQHLATLVRQLMQLAESDIRGTDVERHPVDLRHIAGRAIEMFSAVAEERSILLMLRLPTSSETGEAGPFQVVGTEGELRQVVTNLLDNAIKFSPPGGDVIIGLATDPERRMVKLTVEDQGVGISDEDVKHVFDRFFQADRSRQRVEARGIGLGLSICDAIVKQHRGEISVSSELGRGTIITVLLPLAE